MGQSAFVAILYILASLLCVGLGSYATYHGFASMLGVGAAFAAAAIGIGLMVCNVVLLHLVRQKKNITAFIFPFLALVVFAIFSSISNFTYFYSLVMRDNVSAARFTEADETFDKNVRDAQNALAPLDDYTAHKDAVEALLRKLRAQVESVQEPGFGQKALKHLDDIYAQMSMTKLRPPPVGATSAANQNWLSGFEPMVRNELKAEAAENPIANALSQIDDLATKQRAEFNMVRNLAQPSVERRKAVVKEAADATSNIQNIAAQAIKRLGKPADLKLKPTSYDGMELMNVNYVAESVRRNDSPGMAILTGAFAVFLDFIPLLIAAVIATIMGPASKQSKRKKKGRYVVLEGEDYAR